MPGTPGMSLRGQVGGPPRMGGGRHPRGAQRRRDGLDLGRTPRQPGGTEVAHRPSRTLDESQLVAAWRTAFLFSNYKEPPWVGRKRGSAGRRTGLYRGGDALCSTPSWFTTMQLLSWMSTPWTSYFKSGEPARMLASLDQEESRRHTRPALGGARGVAAKSTTRTGRVARPPLAESGKHAVAPQE